VRRWKRGFYHIAKAAQVPIVLGFIDYKKKELGILGTLHLSDDEDVDLEKIRKVYENIGAKHPERYNKDSIK
jgi:1-acyl-sn-glycerol-3-phosphate acyltransferase